MTKANPRRALNKLSISLCWVKTSPVVFMLLLVYWFLSCQQINTLLSLLLLISHLLSNYFLTLCFLLFRKLLTQMHILSFWFLSIWLLEKILFTSENWIHHRIRSVLEFKNKENSACTNLIESFWHAVKQLLPKTGTQKSLYDSYLGWYECHIQVSATP